ncbi:gamma-glutamyl-gamma-aminobutyrate hydrolase family protein, partial [Acinetobacter baumannii]
TARTDDGLVQAIETLGDDYLVAVQWHPEENAEDRRLFLGLVAAAARYRGDRSTHQEVPA